jgi:beta-phosphoglucomutase family hydrolase
MSPDQTGKIAWDQFDAVLFDLDGVLTDTARLHTEAWKRTFDEFLRRRAEATGEPFRPFDPGADYLRYVDGRPRFDGVRDFLRSREIDLPEGPDEAAPGFDTVRAVGNQKNELVNELFESRGVEAFPGSVALVRQLRTAGLRTGVVTSSGNCEAVLAAAKIQDLFEVKVDADLAARKQLAGKPAPDTFLEAARALGSEPGRSVVVEDAISGVQAGRSGGFGLVIGVARKGNADALRESGADVVVSDLAELVGPEPRP